MKFLVDECTGTSVVACLRDKEHDAVAVVEVMPEANDEEILDRAVSEGRIVVANLFRLRHPPRGDQTGPGDPGTAGAGLMSGILSLRRVS